MKYSLDIKNGNDVPFINIEADTNGILIGAYECREIKRKLFNLNKQQTEALIKGLEAALTIID